MTASGGTPGTGPDYTYEWNTVPIQNTETATGLGAGTYTVIVTDDNGCTASETVTITEPVVLSLTTNSTDAQCNQQADGTATVNPSGGTGPYTYQWTPGGVNPTAIDLLAATIPLVQ